MFEPGLLDSVRFFIKYCQHVWLAAFNDDYEPLGSLAVQIFNIAGIGSLRFCIGFERPKIVDATRFGSGNFRPPTTSIKTLQETLKSG